MLDHHNSSQNSCDCRLDQMGIRLNLQRLVLYKPSLIDMEGVVVIFPDSGWGHSVVNMNSRM